MSNRFSPRRAVTAAFLSLSLVTASQAALAAPDVVASIRPIHSIVASVMAGVGEPKLLLTNNSSPHDASLKPSQARMMENADLVVWVGPSLETFLIKPLSENAKAFQAMEEEETAENEEKHAEGEHKDHDDHAHKDEHGHDEHAEAGHKKDEHAEEGGHHHHHHGADPHVWLDPHEVEELATKLADRLAKLDPDNAATYKANAEKLTAAVEAWEAGAAKAMKPLAGVHYVVAHDAYERFAEHFKLEEAVAISPGDDRKPGAARVRELHAEMDAKNITCLLREPDTNEAMLNTVAQGRDVKLVNVDPLGRGLEAGPALYLQVMNKVQAAFSTCLSKS
ncbi:MAG: zinc ABC transporter substrate-binding protein [Pseudomonadota bacterium]